MTQSVVGFTARLLDCITFQHRSSDCKPVPIAIQYAVWTRTPGRTCDRLRTRCRGSCNREVARIGFGVPCDSMGVVNHVPFLFRFF